MSRRPARDGCLVLLSPDIDRKADYRMHSPSRKRAPYKAGPAALRRTCSLLGTSDLKKMVVPRSSSFISLLSFSFIVFFHVFTLEYPSFNSLPSTMPHERRSEFTKDRQGWASQVIILELKSASRGDAAGAAVVGSATLSPGTLPRSLVSLTSPLLLRSREQPRPHHADIASCSWNTLFCHALDKGM